MAATLHFPRGSQTVADFTPLAQRRACDIARHYRHAQAEAHPARREERPDPVLLLSALGAGRPSDPGGLTRLSLWSRCLSLAMTWQTDLSSNPDAARLLAQRELQRAFTCWKEGEGRHQGIVTQAAFHDYVQCLERILLGQHVDLFSRSGSL